jgi:putative oxidoreductase
MTDLDLGLLVLRLAVGLTFAAHGAQKAFGWWEGPGVDGWQAAVDRMGFRPTPVWATISIGAELVGGLMLALGFLTPLAGMFLIGQEVVIIVKAHLPRGFFNTKGGFEYPLALAAGTAALVLAGAGALSVDNLIGVSFADWTRPALIGVGLLGGLGALASARSQPAPASA